MAQYPALAPPQISVNAIYTGANAQEVETRGHHAARAGDQRRRGHALHDLVEHATAAFSSISVTFDITRDQDLAQVDVQNRVSQALGRLPTEVRRSASPSTSSTPAS